MISELARKLFRAKNYPEYFLEKKRESKEKKKEKRRRGDVVLECFRNGRVLLFIEEGVQVEETA